MTSIRSIAVVCLLCIGGVAHADEGAKPNVLFIVVDDLNMQLGCYGSTVVRSPNLDRLAAKGIRFDRAYCNYPVCNASRTSFLSGLRPDTTQVFTNGVDPRTELGGDFQFLPEYFRARGYEAIGVGKIPHTPEHIASITWDYFDDPGAAAEDDKKSKRASKSDEKKRDLRSLDDAEQPDGIAVRRAVEFIKKPRDKPLFLAVGLHRPHGPRVAPQKYFDMYPALEMKLPEEPPDHTDGIPSIALPPQYNPDWSEKKWQSELQTYYACVTFMDAQVGVLLEALDRLDAWKNTIVVFFSDHSSHLGEHGGFWGKQSLMEESVRIPLLIYAPGKASGDSCPRVVELIDLFPTLTDLAGLPAPSSAEGRSLVSLLDKPSRKWNHAAYSVTRRGKQDLGRSVRTERWTYIVWPDGSEQLYDYAADPKEYNNLAQKDDYASVIAEMKALLDRKP
ncbi:MAG TPA: sulfatase [Pirellulales bacterium]|nr:sulfatase [Pirellulales bacterium]